MRRLPWQVPRRGQAIATALAALFLLLSFAGAASAAEADTVARGAYLASAAGCENCHTDKAQGGQRYAGGPALPTRFGTFYGPNITADPDTGIGRWTDAQFLEALRDGVRADGANLFPAFPYPSFTGITDADALAIKAYLFSLPPVRYESRPQDVWFPFSWRSLVSIWKLLFLTEGPFQPLADRSAEYNRGAYLVTVLGHCGECHTPRNWFGAMEADAFLAGTSAGPDGKKVPNITPDQATGIGKWSEQDIVNLLKDGQTPDFDFVGGAMSAVVNDTAQLTDADRKAIAVFLKSVPAKPFGGKG